MKSLGKKIRIEKSNPVAKALFTGPYRPQMKPSIKDYDRRREHLMAQEEIDDELEPFWAENAPS